MMLWALGESDEVTKIFRINTGNRLLICDEEGLNSNTKETGLYNYIHLINHACVPPEAGQGHYDH